MWFEWLMQGKNETSPYVVPLGEANMTARTLQRGSNKTSLYLVPLGEASMMASALQTGSTSPIPRCVLTERTGQPIILDRFWTLMM